MIFISLAYILDYIYNNKYIVEFRREFNSTTMEGEKSFNNIWPPELNKKISVRFNILTHTMDPIEEKEIDTEFAIIFNRVPIKQNEFVETK